MRTTVVSLLMLLTWAGALRAEPAPRPEPAPGPRYLWLGHYDPAQSAQARIAPPAGYERPAAKAGSFAEWLGHLPLKPGRPAVLLFDGTQKGNQEAHVAAVNMDVGTRDLQQCADSVIRLRAEYLLSVGDSAGIHFKFTSGDVADWTKWASGQRVTVKGSKVTWARTAGADASYPSFRRYLDVVFTYAGTRSLSGELKAARPTDAIEAGDVFVQAGSPGHALIVVDVAVRPGNGKRVFLLAQGYMPAQEMHILRNPADPSGGAWYDADFGAELKTPEWTFLREHRKRF